MFEYAVLLFVLSILLLLIYLRFKDKLPLSPRVVYCTLAISFTLGLFFPLAVARTSTGGILIVYASLVLLSSAALSFLENRTSTNVSPEPLKVSELERMQNVQGEGVLPADQSTAQDLGEAQDIGEEKSKLWGEETDRTESFAELLSAELATREEHEEEISFELPAAGEPAQTQEIEGGNAGEIERAGTETEEQAEGGKEVLAEKEAAGDEIESGLAKKEADALLYENGSKELFCGEPKILEDVAHEQIMAPPAAETKTPKDSASASDWITAGFTAKGQGDFAGALTCFFKALSNSPSAPTAALIALEISSIYQELGQYTQAALALKAITQDLSLEGVINERISYQIAYLERLEALLEAAKIKGAPYSKVPSLIKIKANLETAEKLKMH